jgi:hypothetical protein
MNLSSSYFGLSPQQLALAKPACRLLNITEPAAYNKHVPDALNIDTLERGLWSDHEIILMHALYHQYNNRLIHDTFSVSYAVNAMQPDYFNSSTRAYAMRRFTELLVTPKGFKAIATFKTTADIARELGIYSRLKHYFHY